MDWQWRKTIMKGIIDDWEIDKCSVLLGLRSLRAKWKDLFPGSG